jgi:hypothetical protein
MWRYSTSAASGLAVSASSRRRSLRRNLFLATAVHYELRTKIRLFHRVIPAHDIM